MGLVYVGLRKVGFEFLVIVEDGVPLFLGEGATGLEQDRLLTAEAWVFGRNPGRVFNSGPSNFSKMRFKIIFEKRPFPQGFWVDTQEDNPDEPRRQRMLAPEDGVSVPLGADPSVAA